jgi:hypothetical protein
MEIELEPPQKKTGRPSSHDPLLCEEILNRIMEGEMLTKICTEERMPSRITFYGWMKDRPAFKDAYTRARLAWADYWAERALTLSLDGSQDVFIDGETGKAVIDHAAVARSRLAVDSIKWLCGKWAPRVYGEKPQDEAPQQALTFRWQVASDPIAEPPAPPKQITYKKPELPADLSEADWSVMLDLLEMVKRTIPANSDKPPAEIFAVMKQALKDHFR